MYVRKSLETWFLGRDLGCKDIFYCVFFYIDLKKFECLSFLKEFFFV